jgi:hypothetical protein
MVQRYRLVSAGKDARGPRPIRFDLITWFCIVIGELNFPRKDISSIKGWVVRPTFAGKDARDLPGLIDST